MNNVFAMSSMAWKAIEIHWLTGSVIVFVLGVLVATGAKRMLPLGFDSHTSKDVRLLLINAGRVLGQTAAILATIVLVTLVAQNYLAPHPDEVEARDRQLAIIEAYWNDHGWQISDAYRPINLNGQSVETTIGTCSTTIHYETDQDDQVIRTTVAIDMTNLSSNNTWNFAPFDSTAEFYELDNRRFAGCQPAGQLTTSESNQAA